jgi:hypothetical protein
MDIGHQSVKIIKKMVPPDIKHIIKKIIFRSKYGFYPPPFYTDLSGYEVLLDFIKKYKIYDIQGDIVEIGAFLGGGTYKLCKFYEKYAPDKKIYVIDIFNPESDFITCTAGIKMKEIYTKHLKQLGAKNQIDIFRTVTKSCKNFELLIGDSKEVLIPSPRISFAYIDGNHSSEYVVSDFYKVWEKISPEGVVAFDDYGYDLPNVTQTIDDVIGKESERIKRIHTAGLKTIFIVKNIGSIK